MTKVQRPAGRGRRAFGLASAALAGAAAFLWLSDGGRLVQRARPLIEEVDRLAVMAGWPIGEIRLAGHRETSDEAIYAAIGPFATGSLAGVDVERARAALLQLPWIESAIIERQLPDRLLITVKERVVVAIHEIEGRRWLIDRTGRVLGEVATGAAVVPGLLRVSGDGAAAATGGLIEALRRHPNLSDRIAVAERVGGRRWTLRLADGLRVHLPANALEAGLDRFALLLAGGTSVRTALVVDLRLLERPVGAPPANRGS